MSDSPSASFPRFGVLGGLRASLDDRTFFRRGTVICLTVSALVLAVLHTFGVLGGLVEVFKIGDWGPLSWMAALVAASLGIFSGLGVALWTARRASDIGRDGDTSLLRQGLWLVRIGVETVALWMMFGLFATGMAMVVAGDSGAQVFQIVFAAGIEVISDVVFELDLDSEGWFRLLGIVVAVGAALVAYLIAFAGYFFVDVLELGLRFYGRGGDFFERKDAAPAAAVGAASGFASSLGFFDPLAKSIDDRSLFGRTASLVVRFLVWVSAIVLVYAMLRGLFAFYDGMGPMLDHAASKLFVLLVPAAGLVTALGWVLWVELSKERLSSPNKAGGALGLALVVLRLFVEFVAITALIGVATFGVLMLLTGEDVFIVMLGVVGQGLNIAEGNIGDLARGGWFGSRAFGLALACMSILFGLLYAFAGYVWYDSVELVLRFMQRGCEFFGRDSGWKND
jgi:hypothetical protein